VLVVDDERLMREVSKSILEESGFEVLTAASGPQALEVYRRDREAIRVVLLDNKMPEMDGFEVLEELRRLDPSAQVILMSGYQEKDVLSGVENPGISGFLQKPFRPDDLLRKVREALEASGL
jgi:CheY-like chemotaxis protein